MTEPRDLIPVIVAREKATLPDGYDRWGIKSVHPDLRTYKGYQWPFPGGVAHAQDVDPDNTGACPGRPGDGLCVATTWQGMASGGIPARTLLLVAYRDADILGRDEEEGKLRCRDVAVVAVVDGERLLREAGAGVNLYGADLTGADLSGADLGGANLSGANLSGAYLGEANLSGANLGGANLARANLGGADLGGADLGGADLGGADLGGANLSGANLSGAYLGGANLGGANLGGANLARANLYRANLSGANLYRANLSGANLRGANLGGANLGGADLYGATHDTRTTWPAGYTP